MGRTGRRATEKRAEEGERFALVLDVENLAHDRLAVLDVDGCALRVSETLDLLSGRGVVSARVVSCSRGLARRIAPALWHLGVRVLCHDGGRDAADKTLVDYLGSELPASVTTVVIGSGDHRFAPQARLLKLQGRRCEVMARRGTLSARLAAVADRIHWLVPPRPAGTSVRRALCACVGDPWS